MKSLPLHLVNPFLSVFLVTFPVAKRHGVRPPVAVIVPVGLLVPPLHQSAGNFGIGGLAATRGALLLREEPLRYVSSALSDLPRAAPKPPRALLYGRRPPLLPDGVLRVALGPVLVLAIWGWEREGGGVKKKSESRNRRKGGRLKV